MSLAIAMTPRNEVAGHFGKAAAFEVFDVKGQRVARVENNGNEVGCKQKKRLQRQLSELGVSEIVLGNIGQRSLARLLNAGFKVSQVPPRSQVAAVLAGEIARQALTSAEQGRPCKREKGDCGCGCGSKSEAEPAKIGTVTSKKGLLSGLSKIRGLKL